MAEPILWTIETSLKTALDNITTGNGYFYTFTDVDYGDADSREFNPGTLLLSLIGTDRQGDETQGKYYWRANFQVLACVSPTATATSDDQRMIRAWSDIQKAVMADPRRTVSSVQYAIDTQVLSPRIQDASDKRLAVSADIEVYYRTSITDPTSL